MKYLGFAQYLSYSVTQWRNLTVESRQVHLETIFAIVPLGLDKWLGLIELSARLLSDFLVGLAEHVIQVYCHDKLLRRYIHEVV